MQPFGSRVLLENRTDKRSKIKQATLSPVDASNTAEKKKTFLSAKFCLQPH